MHWPAGALPYELPFTLGHEVAGTVAGLGPGAEGVEVGDSVIVYGPWGCGRCTRCSVGEEHLCEARRAARARVGPGPRRRPGRVHDRAVAAADRSTGRPRPGRGGAARRRGAHPVPRDPPRAAEPARGRRRGRHRRGRARSRRRPDPAGAHVVSHRRRRPARAGARARRAGRSARHARGRRPDRARGAPGRGRARGGARHRLRRRRADARARRRHRGPRRSRLDPRRGRRDLPDALRRRAVRDVGRPVELGHARRARGRGRARARRGDPRRRRARAARRRARGL